MPLQDIPFYGAYVQKRMANEAQPMQQLQQVSGVLGLQAALQKQAMEREALAKKAAFEREMAAAQGNPEAQRAVAMKYASPEAIIKMRTEGGFNLSPGQTRYDASGNKIVSVPSTPDKPQAEPEIVRLQKYLAGLPAGDPHRSPIEARIKMLGERQPGVQVNMPPSSGTFQGPDGKFYVFRVGKDGKTEALPVQTATGEPLRPPESQSEKAERARAGEQEATVESVRQRIASMTQKLQQNAGVVGPGGIVRRGVETVAGMVAPNMPTPALDYQNEMRLLVADVRKVVEKDPNLSNQERQNLYETLGGGTFQTPGSAFRTLNNVLGYMENKRMTGPNRNAQIEKAVKSAGWSYEPDKYEYRVMDGKVQRKAK